MDGVKAFARLFMVHVPPFVHALAAPKASLVQRRKAILQIEASKYCFIEETTAKR